MCFSARGMENALYNAPSTFQGAAESMCVAGVRLPLQCSCAGSVWSSTSVLGDSLSVGGGGAGFGGASRRIRLSFSSAL